MYQDKTFSVRLNEEEQEYIHNFWDNSFNSFTHSAIKDQIKLTEKNHFRNKLKHNTSVVLYLLIATMMVIQVLTTTNIFLQLFASTVAVVLIILSLFEIVGDDNVRQ